MELLNKLSPYNFINFLIPGVIFCSATKRIWAIDLAGTDLVASVFIYYFVGMCVSRVGSVMVEPVLQKFKFVSFSEYQDYLIAEKNDTKLEELLCTANFYRSILGGLFVFLLVWVAQIAIHHQIVSVNQSLSVFGIGTALILQQSYRKQVSYIKKRVDFRK
ncbi:hypothetical protein [Amylibacter sp. IMCC11727]|uniref:hypothetical protein n=1 Tax=Amylibacter sp. IMCC11727 TaxID=3039851 RepID=UPI00244D9A82|nr:hypothetical protein [Amylibacter sp. IMCC11727]WGI22461.1 hypothetical protein QBD29_03315 [Amylibacter sp. IMCC11727]